MISKFSLWQKHFQMHIKTMTGFAVDFYAILTLCVSKWHSKTHPATWLSLAQVREMPQNAPNFLSSQDKHISF